MDHQIRIGLQKEYLKLDTELKEFLGMKEVTPKPNSFGQPPVFVLTSDKISKFQELKRKRDEAEQKYLDSFKE